MRERISWTGLILAVAVLTAGCAVRPPAEPSGGAGVTVVSTNETTTPAYGQSGEEVTTPTAIPQSDRDDVDVREIQRLLVPTLNDYRSGVAPPVFEDKRLSRIARKKSHHMATHDYVRHERPGGGDTTDWLDETDYACLSFGETLLKTHWNQSLYSLDGRKIADEGRMAAHIIELFDNSASHRTALLDATYRTVGVGVYVTADGAVYVTILLCN